MALPAISAYPLPRAEELPASGWSWRLHPRRAVLLVHDMQRYFTRPFAGAEPLGAAVANIDRLRRACADAGVPVIYTRQPGGQSRAERGLLQDVWGPGLPADPELETIVAELTPAPGDTVLTKRRYSAFLGTDLADRLAGRDQMIITGIYAHIGVTATAVEAFSRDIAPFLVGDAVADFNAAHHADALRYVAGRCGVVVDTDAAVTALVGVPA
ncbi:isochorismatase family protein [Pilimelia columellifera]|uniref:Phenazine biosynthesis protein PhzD n=1 Tax=Pilimelia columellifera subsp. columellifera TaxID=706583 RepID=A0ABN3N1U8_9ACTN